MKRKILLLATLILSALPIALSAQMTYVPDDIFEWALIHKGLDSGPLNDSVPTNNIDTLTSLDVSYYSIYDLTGIEDFIALIYLNCCNNWLKSLDISKNTALTELVCCYNYIESLDISKNTFMTVLNCNNNAITSLDVFNNSSLTGLVCGSSQLTSLNVSKNTRLFFLYTTYSPDLFCIQVADSLEAANNLNWDKDNTAHYSENCNYTAVEDNKYENEAAAIAPNPATDYIEIKNVIPANAGIQVRSVTIYNILGEIVVGSETNPVPFDSNGGTIKINIAALPQGTYFIRFNNEIRKFIKF